MTWLKGYRAIIALDPFYDVMHDPSTWASMLLRAVELCLTDSTHHRIYRLSHVFGLLEFY